MNGKHGGTCCCNHDTTSTTDHDHQRDGALLVPSATKSDGCCKAPDQSQSAQSIPA